MITTNPITANDLKELIISTMVEYLKNNSVTLGGVEISSVNITGDLTVNGNTSLQGCTYKGTELTNIPSNNRYQGLNPLNSTSEDTPEFWHNHPGIYWISKAGILLNQPNQYGTLITYNWNNSLEIAQIFIQHPDGYAYTRSANTNGWNGNGNNIWHRLDNV